MLILILKEIAHRKANFLLSLFSVIIAVAMFVSFFTIGEASKRETNRLMREIGFNLRIIPKDTDMTTFWTVGFSQKTMPHEYINHISDHPGISYEHLTATLQRRAPAFPGQDTSEDPLLGYTEFTVTFDSELAIDSVNMGSSSPVDPDILESADSVTPPIWLSLVVIILLGITILNSGILVFLRKRKDS